MANYCKYYKYQKYISRDNGQTWNQPTKWTIKPLSELPNS